MLGWMSAFACSNRITDVGLDGGASSQGQSQTDGHGDTDVAPNDDANPTVEDAAGEGTVASPPIELCPPVAAQQVAIDSGVRLMFETPAEPVLASAQPLEIACDGVAIGGEVEVGLGQIVWHPAFELPANATCDVTLADGAVVIDGDVSGGVSWSFATGESAGAEHDFDHPITLSDSWAADVALMGSQGNRLVVGWRMPVLTLAVSTDGGDHFEIHEIEPIAGPSLLPAMHFDAEWVHVVWVIWDNDNDHQAFYARTDLETVEEPLLLQSVGQPMVSMSPSVTADGAGEVVVTWVEQCPSESRCPAEDPGIYMKVSSDNGATFGPATRVVAPPAWGSTSLLGPHLAWVDGGVAAVWNRYTDNTSEGLQFLDGSSGFATVHEIAISNIDGDLDQMTTDDAAALWIARPANGPATTNFARMRRRTADGIDPPRVLATQILDSDHYSAIGVQHENIAIATTDRGVDGARLRRLMVSDDAGLTVSAPQWLDAMLAVEDGEDPLATAVPDVATDGSRVHLAWTRVAGEEFSVRYTSGDRIAPCGMRSVN